MTFTKMSRIVKSFVFFLHSFEGSSYVFSNMENIFCMILLYIVTPQIFGGHFFFFSYKSSMYFSFTYPKYMKLYCSNIFLQKAAQGHNPTFFLLTASREHRLLVYLKGGGGGGYSPPKCTCNDCIENTFK